MTATLECRQQGDGRAVDAAQKKGNRLVCGFNLCGAFRRKKKSPLREEVQRALYLGELGRR